MIAITSIGLLAMTAGSSLALPSYESGASFSEVRVVQMDPPEATENVFVVDLADDKENAQVVVSVLASPDGERDAVLGIKGPEVGKHFVTAQPTAVYELSQDEGGESYSIKIENGKVTTLTRNGEKISADRFTFEDGKITILDDDGNVLYKHNIHMFASDLPAPPGAPHVLRFGEGGNFIFNKGDNKFFTDTAGNKVTWDFQPHVMVGINQGVPSDALRYQLNISEDQPCILIERVIEGLPADIAGLKKFDIVLKADGKNANDSVLRSILSDKDPGDSVTFSVIRKGEPVEIVIELAEFDDEKLSPDVPFFTSTDRRVFTSNEAPNGWIVNAPQARAWVSAPGAATVEILGMPSVPQGLHEFIFDTDGFNDPEKVPELIEKLREKINFNADRLQFDGHRLMIRDEASNLGDQVDLHLDETKKLTGEAPKGAVHRVPPESSDRLREIEDRLDQLEESLSGRLERLFDRLDSISKQLKEAASDSE